MTICLRPRSGLRMNFRVRSVMGWSDAMILLAGISLWMNKLDAFALTSRSRYGFVELDQKRRQSVEW